MLFSRSSKPDPKLVDQLEALEWRAERATSVGAAATYLNQAGDLCLEAGRMRDALEYYGRTVDAHLAADRFEAASSVCRKILRAAPDVVRARCTLTWLALANGLEQDARTEAEEYLAAAERAGAEVVALLQVRRMVNVAESVELRLYLAEVLMALGDQRTADEVIGRVLSERNGLEQPLRVEADERRSVARRAAIQGPRLGW
jgi:tetratricopeptide (TPR) repeat protein